jgi:hypothetical protein
MPWQDTDPDLPEAERPARLLSDTGQHLGYIEPMRPAWNNQPWLWSCRVRGQLIATRDTRAAAKRTVEEHAQNQR